MAWNIGPFRCGSCMWDHVSCVEGSVSAKDMALLLMEKGLFPGHELLRILL